MWKSSLINENLVKGIQADEVFELMVLKTESYLEERFGKDIRLLNLYRRLNDKFMDGIKTDVIISLKAYNRIFTEDEVHQIIKDFFSDYLCFFDTLHPDILI